LRKPAAGETQDFGYIERTECNKDGMFFFLKTTSQTLRLKSPAQGLNFRAYTPDVESLQIGCGMKPVEIPVVFIFKGPADIKRKVAGELVSLEFVPKTFTLQ
jgi:hypothetical protein